MPNIVFKLLDRLVLTENPKSFHSAVDEVRRLFDLYDRVFISFFIVLPQVGSRAELSESSWKHLEYGSLIEVVCIPEKESRVSSIPEDQSLSSFEITIERKSPLSSQHSSAYSYHHENYDISRGPSLGRHEGIFLLAPQFSAHRPSEGSASGSCDLDPEKIALGSRSASPESAGSFFEKVDAKVADQISVILEYPENLDIPCELATTAALDINQQFQVLFGSLAKSLCTSAERIELRLIRTCEIIKLSPIASPAQLRMSQHERIRVRIRGTMPQASVPGLSFLPRDTPEGPEWIQSFTANTPKLGVSEGFAGRRKGPPLPTSPRSARSKRSTPPACSKESLIKTSASWSLGTQVVHS